MRKLFLLIACAAWILPAIGQSLSGNNAWTGSNYFGGGFQVGEPYPTNSFEILDGAGGLSFHVGTNGVVYGAVGFTLVSAETNGVAWLTNSYGQLIATNTGPAYTLSVGSGLGKSLDGNTLTISNSFTFPGGSWMWVSNSTHLYWSTAEKTVLIGY